MPFHERTLVRLGLSACLIGLLSWAILSAFATQHESLVSSQRATTAVSLPRPMPRRATVVAPVELPRDPSGYLVDGNGAPVVGGVVSIDLGSQTSDSEPTGPDGVFYLPAEISEGIHPLRIDGPNILAATALWQAGSSPRIMVNRSAQVVIQIVDASGPVVDAEVRLLRGKDPQGDRVQTDSKGVARFEDLSVGVYQVVATADNRVTPLATIYAQQDDLPEPERLQLSPGTTVQGRVHSGGLGVEAGLRFIPLGHEHAVFDTKSDPSGTFSMIALPRGQWRVETSTSDYAQLDEKRLVANEDASFISIPMTKKGAVSGIVVDEAGRPVQGALIRVSPITGASGQIAPTETVSPESSALRWLHPLSGKRHMPLRNTRRFGAARDGIRPPECGRGHCGVDLGGIRGSVVHAAADGIVVVALDEDRGRAGRYVAIKHAGGVKSFYMHLDSVHTDIEVGSVVRGGMPIGTLGRSGIQRSEPHLHFSVSMTQNDRTYFVDPEPMLRYAIVLPQATLPSLLSHGEKVVLASNEAAERTGDLSQASSVLLSDVDGRFNKKGLAPGRYVVSAVHRDSAPGRSKQFQIRPNQDHNGLRIRLRRGMALHGQVVGPDGPIADAWVRVSQGKGVSLLEVARASVGPDGRFSLRPLDGLLHVEVGAAGFGVLRQSLASAKGRSSQLYELSRFDAELNGQVHDPQDLPMAGARVHIIAGPAGRGRKTTCDEFGFYRFEKLPKGSYKVRVLTGQYPVLETEIRTQKHALMRLQDGGGLQIEVRDFHSQRAIAGIRVLAEGPGAARTSVLADSLGKVALTGLVPGSWRIKIDSSEHSPVIETVSVRAQSGPSPRGSDLIIEMRRGATVAGILRDEDGERVSGARVWVGRTQTKTDLDGRFRLEQVSTGPIVLRAKLGTKSSENPMTLYSGDEFITLEPRLERSESGQGDDEADKANEAEEIDEAEEIEEADEIDEIDEQ